MKGKGQDRSCEDDSLQHNSYSKKHQAKDKIQKSVRTRKHNSKGSLLHYLPLLLSTVYYQYNYSCTTAIIFYLPFKKKQDIINL